MAIEARLDVGSNQRFVMMEQPGGFEIYSRTGRKELGFKTDEVLQLVGDGQSSIMRIAPGMRDKPLIDNQVTSGSNLGMDPRLYIKAERGFASITEEVMRKAQAAVDPSIRGSVSMENAEGAGQSGFAQRVSRETGKSWSR